MFSDRRDAHDRAGRNRTGPSRAHDVEVVLGQHPDQRSRYKQASTPGEHTRLPLDRRRARPRGEGELTGDDDGAHVRHGRARGAEDEELRTEVEEREEVREQRDVVYPTFVVRPC